MKRVLLVLIMCALCLVGCSGESTTGDDTGSKETLSEKYAIGDVVGLAGELFNI